MSIVSHVRLVVLRPRRAGELMVQQWVEILKANAERINTKRKAIIKNENAFQKLIAGESHPAWRPSFNPTFRSKSENTADEISASHLANIKQAYEKYNRKLDDAFATVDGIPAKRFKEAVEKASADLSKGIAERTLPFTGDRLDGRGPAPIAGFWLVGDRRVEGYLRGGDDVMEGGPYRIVREGLATSFKSALANRIVQAGANIIKSDRDPTTMLRQNTLTNSLVQGFVDPALGLDPFATGGLSHVDYIIDNDELYLDVQVSRV